MKITLKSGALVLAVAGVLLSGIGVRGAWEYLQVARAEVAKAVEENIPLSAQVGRLKLLVGQLDDQIGQHNRKVAVAAVALERAEQDVTSTRTQMASCLHKMQVLRPLLKGPGNVMQVGCSTFNRAEVENALRIRFERYSQGQSTLTHQQTALEQQRVAYRKLAGSLAEWKHQRELLSQRVATLEAQVNAQQLARKSSTETSIEGDTLARAQEVAERIEQRLKVEQKLSELEIDPTSDLETTQFNSNIGDQVDQILGQQPEVQQGAPAVIPPEA